MTEHTSTELRESWHVEIKSDGYQEKVTLTAYVDLARIVQIQGVYVDDLDRWESGSEPYEHVFLDGGTDEALAELRDWLHTGVDWTTWNPYDHSVSSVYRGREMHAEVVFLWDEVMSIHLRDGPFGEDMEYWRVELTPELSEKDGVRCWKLTGVSANPPE